MPRLVRIAAPSRLHFGLWSLANPGGREYGGVGAMAERPGLRMTIRAAEKLQASGPHAGRVLEFARSWTVFHSLSTPQCHIVVDEAPPQHVGLGSGTQLGLAVAAGL